MSHTPPSPTLRPHPPCTLPPPDKDVIGLAQTGSGKTGAFSLPILQSLLQKPQELYALILSPTRELAIQIAEQVEALGCGIGVKCAVLVGGIDMMAQAIQLAKRPHVVVGTPGRVVDHLSNTKASSGGGSRAGGSGGGGGQGDVDGVDGGICALGAFVT